MVAQVYVRDVLLASAAPPADTVGVVGWMKKNLFSTFLNSVLSVVVFLCIAYVVYALIDYMIIKAVFVGTTREACLSQAGERVGACWPFVYAKFGQFIYGFYPEAERWRANVVFFIGAVLIATLLTPRVPCKGLNAFLFLVVFPVVGFFLLRGGYFGLSHVLTTQWGGLLVTLVVAVTGIVASLPIGILLALGRRSQLPFVKFASVVFIEFWRGVPLITVLFFATYMLPLFLPRSWSIDGLLRALIGVTLFAAAYMAEVVRGGLQAISRGQYEGAMAVGLSYWKMMVFIILPQALRLVIPGIVNTFIGLFKDTTLVAIVAIFDLLNQIRSAVADPYWSTPGTIYTGFAFAGIIYFFFCYGMSKYSIFVERRLKTSR
jgi:general L-amino acid transport system permease protein